MRRTWMAAVLAAAVPALLGAQDDYRHGRVRYAEDGVSLQTAAEPVAEEARANMPFLPGDRVWTDDRGRVEFQFGAAFLRLDESTKLDYLDDAGRTVLRLWSGSLYAHADGGTDFEIETPAGVIATRGRGIVRVDARSGGVRLSVYEGEATFGGTQTVRVRDGERLYAREGEAPRAETFDRAAADDFAMWADDRQEKVRYARQVPPEVPAAAEPFYDELYDHGTWATETEIGSVWYPRVPLGWSPYTFGRWMFAPYGWTWVAAEPWGWGPSHYGRWGFSSRGWYWVPRGGWSPAWVQWAVGGPAVGWCPLGYHDRPLYDPYAYVKTPLGRVASAVPRGLGSTWRYARVGDLTKWNHAANGWQPSAEAARLRVIDSPRARLMKDLRVVEGAVPVATPRTGAVPRAGVVPRAGQTRSAPEASAAAPGTADPTSIPAPMARRRSEVEAGRSDRGSSFGQAGRVAGAPEAPSAEAAPAAVPRAERRRPPREYSAPRVAAPRDAAPADPAARTRAAEPRGAEPRAAAPRAAEPQRLSKPAEAAPPRQRSGGDEGGAATRKSAADPASTDGGARRRDRQ